EEDHLALFTAGLSTTGSWNKKEEAADLYYIKGVIETLANHSGIQGISFHTGEHARYEYILEGHWQGKHLITIGKPNEPVLKKYDIRSAVWHADIHWSYWLEAAGKRSIRYREISKYPAVQRDLSFVAGVGLTYAAIQKELNNLSIPQLKSFGLFDIFKSEKLGKDKQSMAMNFTFQDEQKTMKDEEIDAMMSKITKALEKNLQAEIRK
ncbi:MAG: hypothetical protein RLZZ45_1623, partial [Bacteroidota bacterium]